MRTWTAWCVALFFFGARADITQSSGLVVKEDERTVLTCSQNDNHNYMYWYLQQPGKGLQLIYYSFGENDKQEGDIPTGYEAKRLSLSDFHLHILSPKKNYSAVYFCASSENTTLQSHLLSLHKLALLSSTFLQKGAALSTGRGVGANSLFTNQVLPRSWNKRQNGSLNDRLIARLLFPDQLFVLYLIRTISKDF